MSEDVRARLSVTSSPHVLCQRTTRGIMLDVVIALLPAAFVSIFYFGYRSAVLITVCIASCAVFEYLWCYFRKTPVMVKDLSCAVTGMLVAFNLPAGLPVWQAVFGCFVAIIIVKQLFGGIGCNFVNPALAARVVLALSFPSAMTTYSFPFGAPDMVSGASVAPGVDIMSTATPLNLIKAGDPSALSLLDLFLGAHGGVLGEVSAAALLAGGIYLVVRRVIGVAIPLTFIGSTILSSWLFGCPLPIHAALSGGLFLGAIFMATDYSTSPYTLKGKLIFGLGCGLLTALIRTYGSSTEGVSYALLLMNLLVPYINDLMRRKPFGTGRAKNA